MLMVTVKKDTVKAKTFEKKMITLIKMVKGMEMPDNTKTILLDELRRVHNECLEWAEPEEDFKIIPELQTYTVKAENIG